MTPLRSLAICAAAIALLGCTPDATFVEPLPDYAHIHWVNAVPDTVQQDIRVVDIASNAGLYDANFRGANMFYLPIEAGTRTVRAFYSDSLVQNASIVLQESTLSLTADAGYTYIHAGFARTGQTPAHTALLIPDTPPVPGTGQVAVRAINVGAGLGAVDVFIQRRPVNPSTVDSLPDTRAASNIAFAGMSGYISVGRDSVAADTIRIVFTTAGTKAVLATVLAPTGQAGTPTVDPIAGMRLAGSVLTAILVPRSVAGSRAPQTAPAFTNPSIVYLADRRPPQTTP
jgi:hypothetical protein